MASVREHLVKMHTRAAEHNLNKAKLHKALSSRFRKMHKAQMEDDGDGMDQFEGIGDAFDELAGEEVDMGEYHADCAKSLMETGKAAGMSDSDMVSAVIPSPAVRAIPRHGQPQLDDRTTVDPAFEKIVSVEG
jgi:hypothetical protein